MEITLLQIAQVMSMSDGSISEAEQQLLAELPKRVGFESNPGIDRSEMPSMAALASQLISHSDRCTAARVACLIVGVSRNPGDDHDFNQDERSAYRELITTLNLSEQELRDIEWAAREELKQGKPLVQLIQDTLFGTGEWPSPSLMGPEIPNSRPMKRNQNNQYRTLSSHVSTGP